MDLLSVLIDPKSMESTCFFCFKQNDVTTTVSEKIMICNEYQTFDTTLTGIMEYLFPEQDILFNQACSSCSCFLLEAFAMLQKYNTRKGILNKITNILIRETGCVNEIQNAKLYVTLHLPNFGKISSNDTLKDVGCKLENSLGVNGAKESKCIKNTNVHSYEYCKTCDMKFLSKYLLDKHVDIVHKISSKSVICEYCGKDCKKPAILKVHLNCHRVKSCPYCQKVLKTHSHYKVHIKNHEGNLKRPSRRSEYHCNVCPYKSFNKNSLDAHINKVHLQKRPFVCEICDKGFYKKSNLTEHVLIHSNVKNLTCELCGDSFVTKKTLIEHLRLHNGEKPFNCEICNQSFVTSGRRSDHFKRNHMEKTISCFACDKKFSLKKELNAHLKKVHSQGKNGKELSLVEPYNYFRQQEADNKQEYTML